MNIIYDEIPKENGGSKGIAYIREVYNEDDNYEEMEKKLSLNEAIKEVYDVGKDDIVVKSKNRNTKEYIKEWKRKNYQKNGDKVRAKNKAYYYKYKFNLSSEDMKTYDIHLPLVSIIWDNLEKLKKENPELVSKCLEKYH